MSRRSQTSSTARQHAEWLSLIETSGPFLSVMVLLRVFPQGLDAHDPELAQRLRSAFGEWEVAHEGGSHDPAYHRAWLRYVLTEALELPEALLAEGQAMPAGLEARFAEQGETLRPDLAVVEPDTRRPRLLVHFLAPGQSPSAPLPDTRWKASPATRMMELLHATDVKLGLVTNGSQWLLVHAPRGETTGFASWFAHLWFEEPLTLRAFRALLGVRRFFAVDAGETLEGLLAESSQDQQEVTDQLGYQVRKAVEVLVQAIDRIDQDRGRALLAGFDEHQLYEAALTIMMRLVFLFSAEERGLLLLGDDLYDQHYAVSTLRAQLRETADQLGEEILERRHDAWTRLLATFRAVHGGVQHDRMRLPAYGGALFDPDRFPFLEGRTSGSHWQDASAQPLPIHNRTVLHLLEALQILRVKVPGGGPAEARRLSFRALDIEQIGHVYEGLLDHGAVRAEEPVIGLAGTQDHEPELILSRLEALTAENPEKLVQFLKKETGRSVNALRRALQASGDATREGARDGGDPELPGLEGVAEGDGPGHFDLSAGGRIAERGEVRPGGPDEEGGGLGSGEHRRGLRPEADRGLPAPPVDRHGLTPGTGDPLPDRGATELSGTPTGAGHADRHGGTGPDAQRPDRESQRPPLPSEARSLTPVAPHLLAACGNDAELAERVQPFAALLREDTEGMPVVIPAGGVYVTQTGSRRESGTHYTPRSLTEPIVKHALDPLVYHGPAEGLPPEQWQLHNAAEILDLKVCDFAMGSGAFLVQTCRYLSEKLVEAWELAEKAHPGQMLITPEGEFSSGAADERPLPKDTEERLAIARRAVADACLYGVDKNPMAVEMAKLSLWLITLQKDRPFTFLDHALKCGDSLVGLTDTDQLATWSLDRSGNRTLSLFMADPIRQAMEKRRQVRELPERDVRDVERKARLHAEAERLLARLKLAGDLIVAPEFGGEQAAERATEAVRLQGEFVSFQREDSYLPMLRAKADELLGDVRPFHWCLEYAEVFGGDQPGFDAVLGNPPFLGGTRISGVHGDDYLRYLLRANERSSGYGDLCSFFLRRAGALSRRPGLFGMLATNSISQGETRDNGLEYLLGSGTKVVFAHKTLRWPGSANVFIGVVVLRRGQWTGSVTLDGRDVTAISSYLDADEGEFKPDVLPSNDDVVFRGPTVGGEGFILNEAERHDLILRDPRSEQVIRRFITGDDVNQDPHSEAQRYAIDLGVMEESAARTFAACWDRLHGSVRLQRRGNKITQREKYWWRYIGRQEKLYAAIAGHDRALACAEVSRYWCVTWLAADQVFAGKVVVFALFGDSDYAVLSSCFHVEWAEKNSSRLKGDPSYSLTKTFRTFPRPLATAQLDTAGISHYSCRSSAMAGREIGLTAVQSLVHDPGERSEDIAELRRLHVEMDQAVAAAYGWADLDLGHGFHETRQGLRYTVSDPARRELLDRLLALNHERYEEEVRQGLHVKKKPSGTKRGGRKKQPKDDGGQEALF